MKMHFLSGGRLRMKKRIYAAEADRDETIELPVISTLFRHGSANVLFDTGCHPSIETDAAARWGGLAKLMTPIAPPKSDVIASLAALDLTPDDIDLVINSHLHPDHCGCNEFFRKATIRMPRGGAGGGAGRWGGDARLSACRMGPSDADRGCRRAL